MPKCPKVIGVYGLGFDLPTGQAGWSLVIGVWSFQF